MVVIAMSRPEIDRMHVLRGLLAEHITVNEAALSNLLDVAAKSCASTFRR